jgi:SAM-dependent methyltransferase
VESWRSFDIAPSAITVQRQAFEEAGHKGEFIAQDFLSWQSGAHSFDLAYEQTCLCAVGRDQRQAYEEAMWDALRPGGKLFALFMQTGGRGGPPFHCGLKEMKDIFTLGRWDWDEAPPFRSDHPIGVHELGTVLRKRSA